MQKKLALKQELMALKTRKIELTTQITQLELTLRIDRHTNAIAREQIEQMQATQAQLKHLVAERQDFFTPNAY